MDGKNDIIAIQNIGACKLEKCDKIIFGPRSEK